MADEGVPISLVVNGVRRDTTVTTATTLLDALRWQLDLTGAKECCAEGECGACTVLLDGRPVNSCIVLAVEADGADVGTVEGLHEHGQLSRLQDAFLQEGAVQCGFCIPGMLVAATALLRDMPHPTEPEVREALSGNLCRCAGYQRIVRAVLVASRGATP